MNPEKTYYKNGQIKTEIWSHEAGGLHRLDGPAYREWFVNGQLECEAWRVDGSRHRLDGPAYRVWYEDGQLRYESYHINGVKYNTEAEFQVAVDLYKANEIAGLF